MKIVVLVKQVPDTWGERTLRADGTVDRESASAVIDEITERAVETALQLREAHKGTVTVLTMGPPGAVDVLRKALSMGADSAMLVTDAAFAGSDALQTSAALAAALRTLDFDLVIAGTESTDGATGAIPAMLAERLDLAQLTFLSTVVVDGDIVSGSRAVEDGSLDVRAHLPAIISMTEQAPDPRFPTFRGIMGAKKKPLTTLSAADLGLEPTELGGAHAWSLVRDVTARPQRSAGTVITDDGTGATQLADFLVAAKLL
ncbi:electron transfer flavoprotein subunit beta [Cryobacterium sp. MLB-32]|uniref:electron transfer flavoprotein subunit beta/FixA family protein n=1 Tax=Cryobacterium sp. MLB-32 TaxID=1529318 RepID=UPI0004E705A9|nr:electron transfer flavoprotein subunit beta/FixA family protein [Cryobacterium sp. MLB-32]KFF59331.1 electron transfer flavoprotein subunit beta [Cryobacterium sp. MLB-32]